MSITTTRRGLIAGAALGITGLRAARADTDGFGAEPRAAQKTLRTVALTIVGANGARHEFSVEVARTGREQQVGLMYRRALAPEAGMLFPWPRPMKSEMWMEHTLIPLDMVFIKPDGTIDSIAENTVPESLAIVGSDGVVGSTLELAGGVTAKLGISVGDRVVSTALPKG
jgi:uncharacterized protein